MKKIISLFIFLICVAAIGYIVYNPQTRDEVYKALNPSSCDYPIHYNAGTIDPRFNLSDPEVLADIHEAGQIWSAAYGKELFSYDSKDAHDLRINLVYDSRQALNSQIYSLKNSLDSQKNNLDPQISKYNSMSADFKKRVAALNNQISYWNEHNGAPSDVYKKLIAEQESLQQEASELNNMAKTLNQSTDQFNSQVGQLNQTVNTFNQDLKLQPEEGLYIPQNNKINIYFNNTHQELVHTLAHELGHALGLDHNENRQSIMFAYSTQATAPSQDDLSALQAVCQRHSIFELMFNRIKFVYQRVVNKKG